MRVLHRDRALEPFAGPFRFALVDECMRDQVTGAAPVVRAGLSQGEDLLQEPSGLRGPFLKHAHPRGAVQRLAPVLVVARARGRLLECLLGFGKPARLLRGLAGDPDIPVAFAYCPTGGR